MKWDWVRQVSLKCNCLLNLLVQTIAFLTWLVEQHPESRVALLLPISPTTLGPQWIAQLNKFCPTLKFFNTCGLSDQGLVDKIAYDQANIVLFPGHDLSHSTWKLKDLLLAEVLIHNLPSLLTLRNGIFLSKMKLMTLFREMVMIPNFSSISNQSRFQQ